MIKSIMAIRTDNMGTMFSKPDILTTIINTGHVKN